jgi:hypothetical protein
MCDYSLHVMASRPAKTQESAGEAIEAREPIA